MPPLTEDANTFEAQRARVDAIFGNIDYDLPLVPHRLIPATQSGQFWFSAGIIAVSFVVGAVATLVKGWGLNEFAQSIQNQVRVDTYAAMQRLDLGFFVDKQTRELMSILNNDVNHLEQFLNAG